MAAGTVGTWITVPSHCFWFTVWSPTGFDWVLRKQTNLVSFQTDATRFPRWYNFDSPFRKPYTSGVCGDKLFGKPRRLEQIVSEIYVSSLSKSGFHNSFEERSNFEQFVVIWLTSWYRIFIIVKMKVLCQLIKSVSGYYSLYEGNPKGFVFGRVQRRLWHPNSTWRPKNAYISSRLVFCHFGCGFRAMHCVA